MDISIAGFFLFLIFLTNGVFLYFHKVKNISLIRIGLFGAILIPVVFLSLVKFISSIFSIGDDFTYISMFFMIIVFFNSLIYVLVGIFSVFRYFIEDRFFKDSD
ncbi:hypothetical protein [Lysinibacillus sp. G4S2]|uniref:hypothetical protein n=1 Tax=Lysinibacillus sp. G4S2 TaxID=3055859 RepID=UPI0025A13381|nr:hypothetical protein [Lysinibacillus sp. G4S2]MDM5248577.1 hypothetical protein [Lysinibacillus sp. G4S2]